MVDVLKLEGTPREVGRQYGEAYRQGFHVFHAKARELASTNARWYDDIHVMGKAIASHYPRYYEELAGAAEGADMTLDDVLLNQRSLLYARLLANDVASDSLGSGCSNVAFLKAASGPIFGRNGDLSPDDDRIEILRHVRYENGREIIHSTHVGDIRGGGTCMNADGLTVGESSVGSVFELSLWNPPILVGIYAMMCSCATVEEGIRFLQRYPYVGKGFNFLLVDEHGQGVVLECACPLVQVRRPEPGWDVIFCTNHYNLPALLNAGYRPTPESKEYSERRYRFLERKLYEERVPRTVEQMKALLSAYGQDGGLCRPIDEGDPSETRMSYIAVPKERKFWAAGGRPCQIPYEPVW